MLVEVLEIECHGPWREALDAVLPIFMKLAGSGPSIFDLPAKSAIVSPVYWNPYACGSLYSVELDAHDTVKSVKYTYGVGYVLKPD